MKRLWAFRLGGIGVGLAVLISLEAGLRILQPDFLAEERDQKLNPAGLPYFRIVDRGDYREYRPSRDYVPWGHHFQFSMPKPRGVFRIFSLGDSTANGNAFGNAGAFSRWLSLTLAAVDYRTYFEVINSGQGGFPSLEVLNLEKQVLTAAPDLLIVYVGNNEFGYHRLQTGSAHLPGFVLRLKYRVQRLHLTHLIQYTWHTAIQKRVKFKIEPGAMRAHAAYFYHQTLANHWDREHHDRVIAQFRSNLRQMVEMAQRQGVRVILCTVPVNLRDWEPYGSYHRPGFSETDEQQWDRLVQAGKEAYVRRDFTAAQAYFLQAAEGDPTPADLNYFIGHCRLLLGQSQETYRYFQAAVDRDVLRGRAGSEINAVIREVAASHQVPLADVELEFRRRSPDGVPGDNFFVDFVHPTLEGQKGIAQVIFQTMLQQGWVHPDSEWEQKAGIAWSIYEEKIPPDYLFRSYYTVASVNAFLGRFARARFWVGKGLEYLPRQPEGVKLQTCLDDILHRQLPNPARPWAETDLIRNYHPPPPTETKLRFHSD